MNWKGRFFNNALKQNNFLSAIKPNSGTTMTGHYEQTTGLLPVFGTDNVNGVIKFEVSKSVRVGGVGVRCVVREVSVYVC